MKGVYGALALLLLTAAGVDASAQSRAETRNYRKAIEKADLEAYDRFLSKYPDSAYGADIAARRDTLLSISPYSEADACGIVSAFIPSGQQFRAFARRVDAVDIIHALALPPDSLDCVHIYRLERRPGAAEWTETQSYGVYCAAADGMDSRSFADSTLSYEIRGERFYQLDYILGSSESGARSYVGVCYGPDSDFIGCISFEGEALPPQEQVTIDAFFRMLESNQYKIQYRVMLARYRGKTVCPECHGSRLRPEAAYVKVGGRSITELVTMPVTDLRRFFDELQLPAHDARVAERLLTEIRNRLRFLVDVGLGYLTLDRLSNSLSGGESQRINLATSLGSSLVGSLYILDEPSIGLHSRDTERLIAVLRQLRDLGNTVLVVEHDEEIIRAADYIVDIGPGAGRLGGEVVWAGSYADAVAPDVKTNGASHTIDYLTGRDSIPVPATRRAWNRFVEVKGARANNLKGIDVRFPLNVLTVVTGVSGSGKSTLVRDIFYRALKRQLDEAGERPGEFISLGGDLDCVKAVEFVDQNPIGKSSRSNPVTYVKAYDEIRKLMAEQPLAKQMDFTPAYFSFNADGGRCEECKGEGTVKVPMQFMADLVLECEACGGKRFKSDVLEVRFEGLNIYDILELTVSQAIDFFARHGKEKIVRRLRPLQDVGLGYIKLGQSSATLSGGESQRVKLAYYLGQEGVTPTVFIFDEPTTGLHFHDIRKLMESFNALIERGHTVVVIEHNMDVAKCADHIIDLGPEGGRGGGTVVAAGTPEQVAASGLGYTSRYLAAKLAEAARA